MNLSSILHSVAQALPNCPAITSSNQSLSYGQLGNEIANLAGSYQSTYQLQRGDRVGIAMSNCAEFYPCLFAAWRAGLVAVPINAKLHAREMAWILGNSGAKLCVVSPDVAQSIGSVSELDWPVVVSIGSAEYQLMRKTKPQTAIQNAGTDPAWLFYTSGTTGRPKGAVLTHQNLLFATQAYYADIESVGPGNTILHAAPLSHGSGLYGLAYLLTGANNVIQPSFDTKSVLNAFSTYEKVSMFAAPTMLTRLFNDPMCGDCDTSGLRTIVYGGAPMYASDLQSGIDKLGQHFYHLYGQGESPMTITGLNKYFHSDTNNPRYKQRIGSVGLPRMGVGVDIVDDQGHSLSNNEVGEIVTKSLCVMPGYWNNIEASNAAIQHGWLRTGDMGSIDEDGFLTLKDRTKDLIISGGSNIYPREIEEVLLTHPNVVECAVIGVSHSEWGEEVVACVVTRDKTHQNLESELDKLCLDNIARFKRPKRYRFVEELPKNNYGKILKTELRSIT